MLEPQGKNAAPFRWPGHDDSAVPYAVYVDEDIFRLEQERIFQGPVWSYLGLASEVPKPGDFVSTFIGKTPVVLNRGRDGVLRGNRRRGRSELFSKREHPQNGGAARLAEARERRRLDVDRVPP